MYFDDIETQLHAIIKINQILIKKIQKKERKFCRVEMLFICTVFCIRECDNGN